MITARAGSAITAEIGMQRATEQIDALVSMRIDPIGYLVTPRVAAAVVTVALAWLTYSRGGWVPLLSAFDLAVHEFGHLLTVWAPATLCSAAGSALQIAAPLALAAYFWWRRDDLAVILMVAWAAENLHNVSVYVADAQVMALPLFGDDGSGAGHDWHNILLELGALGSADRLALVLKTASVMLFVVALGLATLGFCRTRRS